MFAGAAFTDSADIKVDTEVVDTLVALGVVNGYDDGSFKPNGTVTRAEMAKMIYVLRTGNSDASAYNDDKTSFTDIGSHWARGYIKYCQSLGIIAGKSNTKFCPNDKVTAQEAAKMLLVTLGYDAAKAGLTGPSWAAKTNALADENGLLEDVNTSFTAACPRQYAAQLIYNTIDTPTVVWRDDAYTNVTLLGTDNKTVGEKYMGLQKWIGTFEGDSSIVSAKDGEITVNGSIDGQHKTITNSTSQVSAVAAQFKADFDNKYVGEEVSVLFKDGNTGTKNQPDAKDTIFGIYVTGNTKVYNIVKGDLQSCSDAGKIKFNDKKYDVAAHDANDDVIVTNFNGKVDADTIDAAGANSETHGATAADVAAYINNAANGLRVKSNDAIKFVTNDDNKIVKAYVTTSKFGKVSSVTSSKIGVEGLGTKDLDDCVVYDGIKAGDLVQYVEAYQSSERKNIITKAETVEGKIEAFKSSDSQIRVNGNWYKFSANTAVATDFTNSALTANDVDDTYKLIVDGKYYVACNKISGFNNYAVATKGTTEFGDTRVKLLKADGSEVTTTVDELKDRAALPANTLKASGVLYGYNLKSSDSKVDLSAKDYTNVASIASGSFNGDAKTVTYTVSGSAAVSKIVASDAAIFVYNTTDDKWKVYTAKDLGNFSLAAQNVQYIVDDNKIVALAVKASSFPTGGSDSTAYGYVTNRIDTKLGDDTVVQLTIWNGSEEVTLNVDGSSCSAYRGDFVEYPIIASDAKANNSDVKVEPTAGTTRFAVVKVKSVEDKRIITTTDTVAANGQVVDGVDTAWTTTSDTVKIGVNTDDKEKSDNNSVVAYTKTFGDDYANAAIFYEVKSGYNEIKAIFIDSDNKLQSYVNDVKSGAAYTVAAPVAAVTGKGLTATVVADKTYAVQGETVTVTVTVTGTAAAAGTVNVSGVTATALNAVGSMTNATVNGTNGINVTAAVAMLPSPIPLLWVLATQLRL